MDMEQRKAGYIVAWSSIGVNAFLFIIKYWAGLKTGSISMVADAWHTLSDSFTSVIVLFGLWYSSKPADRDHPFGHGRAESIAAIVVATLLGLVGINFIIESIEKLMAKEVPEFNTIAVIIFAFSVLVKEAMARISNSIGDKIHSVALKADGWHHRSDALTTVLVLLGVFLGEYIWWIDAAFGIVVSLVILYSTYEIFRTAMSVLLGEKPDKEVIRKVKKTIMDVHPLINDVHHFKLHTYGDHKEMTVDIRLPAEMSVHDAHEIATEVGITVLKKENIWTTVHVEPFEEGKNS